MQNNFKILLISGALIFFWAWTLVFDYYCNFWWAHSGSSFHIRTHSLSWIIIIPFPTFIATCYWSFTREYRSSTTFNFFSAHDSLRPFQSHSIPERTMWFLFVFIHAPFSKRNIRKNSYARIFVK